MKTIKKLLKYEVDKKFVVFVIILLFINLLVDRLTFKHYYWFVFLFSFDYYSLKYTLLITNDK